MEEPAASEYVQITSPGELRNWLVDHHLQKSSIWLITYKKCVPEKYVSITDVLDELLCFGWIDGIRRKLDDERTMQLISPRKSQHWAQSYKERVAKLRREGRMHEAGEASIRKSMELGLWDFMNDVDKLIVPEDLEMKLQTNKEAHDYFFNLNPSSKRFALRWLKLAKTNKTRSKRIEEILIRSSKGEKIPGS